MKPGFPLKLAATMGVTTALVGGGVLVANSNNFAEPGLDEGIDAADVNPETNEKISTDQFDNIAKEIGEEAGLVDEKTKTSLFSISVENITLADSCPSRIPDISFPPENGSFLILDIKASVASTPKQQSVGSAAGLGYMPLVAEAFSVTGTDGNIERNATSQAAWSCFDDAQLVPAVVNPGETVSGKLVLDVAPRTGTVSYDPENNGGWSWAY